MPTRSHTTALTTTPRWQGTGRRLSAPGSQPSSNACVRRARGSAIANATRAWGRSVVNPVLLLYEKLAPVREALTALGLNHGRPLARERTGPGALTAPGHTRTAPGPLPVGTRTARSAGRSLNLLRHRLLPQPVGMHGRRRRRGHYPLHPLDAGGLAEVVADAVGVGVHIGCVAGRRLAGEHLVHVVLDAAQIGHVPEGDRHQRPAA